MVKKKRGKCAKNNVGSQVDEEPSEIRKAPHSFVIHRGFPCPKLNDLTMDFRRVMEPYTATNLRERKKNKIKDFVSLSGTFHVANMCVFNRSTEQVLMKVGRLPRGPTLVFKIHQFTLARDVISSLKRPYVDEKAYESAPLAILNSFSGDGKHLKLMANTLQNMFPTINVGTVKLSTIRRCVLFSYNPTTKLIDFRHFAIRVQPVGVSKGIKKIISGKIPNLAKCEDIADFIEKSQCVSDSEFEDDETSQVVVTEKMKSRGSVENGKSAIKLHEIGPRMTLQLMKIEEGLFNGEVLYHDFITKTEDEKEQNRKKIAQRQKLKESRTQEQNANRQRKEDAKVEHKNKSLAGMKNQKEGSGGEEQEEEEVEDTRDNDAEYYEEALGEAPDEELFTKGATRKRAYVPQMTKMQAKKQRFEEEQQRESNKVKPKPKFKASAAGGFKKGGRGGGGKKQSQMGTQKKSGMGGGKRKPRK